MEAGFVEVQNQLFRLFEEGQIEKALFLIEKARQEYPKRIDKTTFWKACAFSRLGQIDEAISQLQDAISKDIWWNPIILKNDPDLAALQENSEFQRVIDQCERILENVNNNRVRPNLEVYGNREAEVGIFSLHMRGTNIEDFAPHWMRENVLKQYFLGFPQSSQVFGYNAFCWDDPELTMKDISETFLQFQKGFKKPIVLAGASQGGKVIMEISLGLNPLGTKGFIAVIPSIRELESFENLLKSNSVNQIKGVIITGDQDPFYKKTVELAQLLESYQVPCKLVVIKGLAHFIPEALPELLQDAIRYIRN
ncbi:MAG TPA: tetratricopeptide repeat protein [Bacillus sp. (in: firmicutes)]|uniref:tetratricopeptide repeat protein n=1 Tax=Bacillus litorisediminis TaxID=2922713 RepID=UPI001FAF11C5|nr:tetratricopeptide repeat protein [Bacillus litorisediminis]HWO75337.1 tetratricopeptide repeat protein [Bacillus sp. (in: firmicutes)]